MKSFVFCGILMMLLLSSCTKRKEPSIVGAWVEIAYLRVDQSASSNWLYNFRFPQQLTLKENGDYLTFSDVPESGGVYDYNHATRHLRFDTATSGTELLRIVSELNEEILQIDHYLNGILIFKRKYRRH